MDNAKGQVYNLRSLGNVRIRVAKLKKGCFWGFVANEDDKENKKKKKKKKAEPEEQSKMKDRKMEKAKPPNQTLKKSKMEEEDDEVLQIKPTRKAPRSTMLEKEDNDDDEDQVDDSASSATGSSSSSSSSSGSGSSSTWTDSPLLRANEAAVRVKKEKAAEKTGRPHFKVEGRALGLPAGPTRMENFHNDKRF